MLAITKLGPRGRVRLFLGGASLDYPGHLLVSYFAVGCQSCRKIPDPRQGDRAPTLHQV